MKNKNILYLCLLCLAIVVTSCNKDDYTGDSTLQVSNPTATLDITIPDSMVEADMSFPFTITLDQAQVVDLHFTMSLGEGTATEGEDFDYTHDIVIPAYALSGSGSIDIHNDLTIEDAETFTVIFGATSTPNVNFAQVERTVTLQNFVSPDLNMFFSWDGTAVVDGAEVSFCDYVDLDVYVFDTDGNDLGIYDAATGACPEAMVFSGMTDGTYQLMTNLWSSGIIPSDPAVIIEFPITGTFVRGGLFSQSITQSSENSFSTADGDSSEDFRPLATVTIANGEYTITAP